MGQGGIRGNIQRNLEEEMTQHLDLRHRIALEMARSLQKQKVEGHPLKQLFWECTLKCNLSCRHCGSDCKAVSKVQDMPAEDFLKVLGRVKEVYDPHRIMVIVTGGEPLMRKDIESCGREIYRMGFPWGMVSNGFLLTEERFHGLLAAGLHSLTISLDGLEEDHDWMRGRQGCFERASGAIRMVCEYNRACLAGGDAVGFKSLVATDAVAFDVVTCVNRRSYPHLGEIKQFLIDAGLKSWRLFTVFPVGRGALDPELQLPNEDFRGLMEFIKATRKEGRIMAEYGCEGFLGNYEGDVRSHFFNCEAGISVGSVLADGSISACASIRSDYCQGNIYKDDFVDVWENRFAPYRNREWMRRDQCAGCKYWRYCQGNGMHLRDADGKLILCHLSRLEG